MIQHPFESWTELNFNDVITKVTNEELFYQSIVFYLNYKPMHLLELMSVLLPYLNMAANYIPVY